MSIRLIGRIYAASICIGGIAVTACSSSEPLDRVSQGPSLAIAVTPLTLPGITNACYDLSATSGLGATVWSVSNVCATQYGDGEGAITYVAPCDASPGAEETTVALTLTSLHTGDPATVVPTDEYANPCPADAPCLRTATCEPNADVRVTFNIAVMRDAQQGFFDVAVNFDDIFCSAKFDCVEDDLLFNPFLTPVRRDATAVLAFACTAGEDQPTYLHMSDVAIVCDGGATVVSLNPNDPAGPGNLGPRDVSGDFVFEHATYYGGEFLGNPDGIEKCYWNMAIGIWAEKLAGHTGCVLTAQATASSQQLTGGNTPPDTVWPVVTFTIPLALDADQDLACGANPLGGLGSGVQTVYSPISGAHFDHYLECADATPGDHPGTPPNAIDDAAHTPLAVAVVIPVLNNDTGNAITVVSASAPSNGNVVVNTDGTVTYTPGPGFVGQDTFTYTIEDSSGATDTATVTITVGPLAVDDTRTTDYETLVVIDVLDNDLGHQIDVVVGSVTAPSSGSATLNGDGTVTYTPNPGFTGQDTFVYTIVDGAGQTDSALVTITVARVTTCTTPAGQVQIIQQGTTVTVDYGSASGSFTLPATSGGAVMFDCCGSCQGDCPPSQLQLFGVLENTDTSLASFDCTIATLAGDESVECVVDPSGELVLGGAQCQNEPPGLAVTAFTLEALSAGVQGADPFGFDPNPGDTLTYSVADGSLPAWATIAANTGIISVAAGAPITDPGVVINVTVTDGQVSVTVAVTITLLPVKRVFWLSRQAPLGADLANEMVTSGSGLADVLLYADSLCKAGWAAAHGGSTTTEWTAWLSTSTGDAIDRVSNGIFKRPDDAVVAFGKADIVSDDEAPGTPAKVNSRYLRKSINQQADGASPPAPWPNLNFGPHRTITGTGVDGRYIPDATCADWTSTAPEPGPPSAGIGMPSPDTTPSLEFWTALEQDLRDACDSMAPPATFVMSNSLYCFER